MASGTCTVEITLDSTPANQAIADMQLLTKSLDALGEIGDSGLNLPQLPEELFRLEADDLPARAGELRMRLHPTDGFLTFLSACRARYPQLMLVEES